MKILITNDDGIYAKGIEVLRNALLPIASQVFVVAPLEEKSGVGQSITYRDPLRVHKVRRNQEFFGYGVLGTPADCVKLAVKVLLEEKPDLILSGINRGFNFGFNLFYSGTVAGAAEGAIQGFPSIALSTGWGENIDFSRASEVVSQLIQNLDYKNLSPQVLLNINIPTVAIRGVKITRQSIHSLSEKYSTHYSPHGEKLYWLSSTFDPKHDNTEFDDAAVHQGYVSITPLRIEKTCMETFHQLSKIHFHLEENK